MFSPLTVTCVKRIRAYLVSGLCVLLSTLLNDVDSSCGKRHQTMGWIMIKHFLKKFLCGNPGQSESWAHFSPRHLHFKRMEEDVGNANETGSDIEVEEDFDYLLGNDNVFEEVRDRWLFEENYLARNIFGFWERERRWRLPVFRTRGLLKILLNNRQQTTVGTKASVTRHCIPCPQIPEQWIFSCFGDKTMWARIVDETNRYAIQQRFGHPPPPNAATYVTLVSVT